MIYRYSLKPTEENKEFRTRSINGVNLHIDHWSYSDTPLSFVGFEDSVLEEKATTKEDFDIGHRTTTTRVPDPPVITAIEKKIVREDPVIEALTPTVVKQRRQSTQIVIHTDKQLRTHLISKGYGMKELITYSHVQLYELLLLEHDLETKGVPNGE